MDMFIRYRYVYIYEICSISLLHIYDKVILEKLLWYIDFIGVIFLSGFLVLVIHIYDYYDMYLWFLLFLFSNFE